MLVTLTSSLMPLLLALHTVTCYSDALIGLPQGEASLNMEEAALKDSSSFREGLHRLLCDTTGEY